MSYPHRNGRRVRSVAHAAHTIFLDKNRLRLLEGVHLAHRDQEGETLTGVASDVPADDARRVVGHGGEDVLRDIGGVPLREE